MPTEYETIIGLEIHAQLLTKSKMFCGCSADYVGAPPNTHVCPICLGMPGVLPVINQQALEYAVMVGLALNCTISEYSKFDRKNYPYPDLMKGYQISQYDAPLCRNGWITIDVDGAEKRIGITRVHQEEDVAKLFHRTTPEGETYSLVDVNRAGVPLMEIVSEPDMRSPEEARRYFMKLRNILQWLGVASGNMEEGALRCDANVSVRPKGMRELTAKVEVKNMNSFRAVYRALEYEVERQIKVIESGGRIVQETRGWLDERDMTVSQRTKEYAHDYRYFPEPDLPPVVFSRERVEEIRARLPELPDARRDRFISQYGLSRYDADFLTSSRAYADYFETALDGAVPERLGQRAKTVSNWVQGELTRLLNARGLDLSQSMVRPPDLRALLDLIDSGTLSGSMAKAVFEEMFATGKPAAQIVQERGFTQVSDEAFVAEVVGRVLEANPQAVHDYLDGKEQAARFLVGQTMRESKGRANPALVNKILQEQLSKRK